MKTQFIDTALAYIIPMSYVIAIYVLSLNSI